ncbi:unnamed protein product [Durusdinium trenchii]|uniref:Uncharacterized protein n=1 Tax=Durusdinium trenchii TaxID=1381693 RepID=A0ABP0NDF8_9DINO
MRCFIALLTILLGGEAASGEARRAIWFVSWQHAGHIKALCPIATELQRRGHEVRVVVHEEVLHLVPKNLIALSAGPLPWSWTEELQFRQALWDPSPAEEARDARKADLSEQYFAGSQRSLLRGLNETLHRVPLQEWPSLLAIDVSSVGAMDLAEKLAIRFAVISAWPVGPTLQSVGEATDFGWMPSELFAFTQSSHQQSFPDRLKRYLFSNLLPRFMNWAGFHEPRRALRRELDLDERLELLEAPRTSANGGRPLLCILSHWGIDRPRPLPPRAVLVGPVEDYPGKVKEAGELPKPVADWLASGKVVYISFGTNVRPTREVYQAILGAAEGLQDVKFLWDVDESEVQASSLGELAHAAAFPNVHFAPGVPQILVLGHVAAFVTHCGLNSVHEALHFGVPMLGMDFVQLDLMASLGCKAADPSCWAESEIHTGLSLVFLEVAEEQLQKVHHLEVTCLFFV